MRVNIAHYEYRKDIELCNYINDVLLKTNKNIIRIINVQIEFCIGYKVAKIIYEENN